MKDRMLKCAGNCLRGVLLVIALLSPAGCDSVEPGQPDTTPSPRVPTPSSQAPATRNGLLYYAECWPEEDIGGLFLMDMETMQPRLLTRQDETITLDLTTFAFSSAVNQLAYISWYGRKPTIRVVDSRGENRRTLTDPLWVQTSLSWSPTGNEVSYIGIPSDPDNYGRKVHTVNVDDGTIRLLFPTMDDEMASVSWSPTGLVALLIDRGGVAAPGSAGFELAILDPTTEQEIARVDVGSSSTSYAWSHDGKRIAYATDDQMRILEIVTGDVKEFPFRPTAYGMEWSPDDQRLLVNGAIGDEYDIYMFSLDDDQVQNVTDGNDLAMGGAWSPDGTQIAFSSVAPTDREDSIEIVVLDLQSGDITQVTDNEYADAPPRWITWTEVGDAATTGSVQDGIE